MTTTPPTGFGIRPATPADLEALIAIRERASLADNTHEPFSNHQLAGDLASAGLVTDGVTINVGEENGQPVGFHRLQVFSERGGPRIYSHRGFVDPDWRGQGIGSALMDHAEAMLTAVADAERLPDAVLSAWAYDSEDGALDLLNARGYAVHREMLTMERSLIGPIPTVDLPPGLEVRPVVQDELPALWGTYLEVMADDLGAVTGDEQAYRKWSAMAREDGALWNAAWHGSELVGFALGRVIAEPAGTRRGTIEALGVRRSCRRQGIARLLLQLSWIGHRQRCSTVTSVEANRQNANAVSLYTDVCYSARHTVTIVRRRVTEGALLRHGHSTSRENLHDQYHGGTGQ